MSGGEAPAGFSGTILSKTKAICRERMAFVFLLASKKFFSLQQKTAGKILIICKSFSGTLYLFRCVCYDKVVKLFLFLKEVWMMKKSISKAALLLVAVVMVFSSFGAVTAVAAEKIFVLDSGAISITAKAGTSGATLIAKQGSKLVEFSAANDTLVISGNYPANSTDVPITVGISGDAVNVNVRFQGAMNVTAPAGLSALIIGGSSSVNLSVPTASSLTGGAAIPATAKPAGPAISGTGRLTVNSGALSLFRGVSGSITVNNSAVVSATASDTAGAITGAVLINNGGRFNLQSGSIGGAVTLNSGGTLSVASGASTPTNLIVNGGTYQNGGIALYKTVIEGLPAGMTATFNGKTYQVNSSGKITTYLPVKASAEYAIAVNGKTYVSTFAVTANHNNNFTATEKAVKQTLTLTTPTPKYGRDIEIPYTGGTGFTAAAIKQITRSGVLVAPSLWSITDKAIIINKSFNQTLEPQNFVIELNADANFVFSGSSATASIPVTAQKNVGTAANPIKSVTAYTGSSISSIRSLLPTKVTITLDGDAATTYTLDVTWPLTGLSTSTSGLKTTTATVTNPPAHITLPSITANITLERRSSSGGGSTSEADPEYEFWRDILDEAKTAESGDTIRAYAKEYDNFPTSILDALKGKKVTLIIQRSKGDDITIYGKNIKSVESGRITYRLTDLAKLFKNSGSSSSGSSSSRPAPSTAPSTGGTYYPPVVSSQSSSSSSSESSEEESSSEEEEFSSEEEEEFSSEEEIPAEPTDVKPPKKKMSPLTVAIIITVAAAALSGIVACIILQQRRKKDQF